MSANLISVVRRADSDIGDVSGNCSEALHLIERGDISSALLRMEWATENIRRAELSIAEARDELSKAESLS